MILLLIIKNEKNIIFDKKPKNGGIPAREKIIIKNEYKWNLDKQIQLKCLKEFQSKFNNVKKK